MSDEFHPYTKAQMDKILAVVREDQKNRVKARVISAAREYLSALAQPNKKPNPPREVNRLAVALDLLSTALSGLSNAAEKHLAIRRHDSPAYEDPIDPQALSLAVNRFLIENKVGLLERPEPPSSGPIIKHETRRFEERLKFAFDIGGNSPTTKRGYPDFRKMCTEPDVLRLKHMDSKKWEAVRRKKPPNKLPVKIAK